MSFKPAKTHVSVIYEINDDGVDIFVIGALPDSDWVNIKNVTNLGKFIEEKNLMSKEFFYTNFVHYGKVQLDDKKIRVFEELPQSLNEIRIDRRKVKES